MAGFLIMAFFAQSLPIVLIPKQIQIAAVRNDVVYHCCWSKLSPLQASLTERIALKE